MCARHSITAVLALLLLAACEQAAPPATDSEAQASDAAAVTWEAVANGQQLFEGLGPVHMEITTSSPEAQKYFDQGLALAMGFNHAAADFAFTEAAVHDPDCAMCYWGSAFVLGPNLNAPMDPGNVPRAQVLIARAAELAPVTSKLEQALIAAMSQRYGDQNGADRTALDVAWADAMREVVQNWPDDAYIHALAAEALMDLHPWDFWLPDGSAQPWTTEITDHIERALELNPDHIGAIHLYIHAVEQSNSAERAEPHADRLAGLAPSAGHLVHMPAHIYMRVGRYHDSTLTNAKAAEMDAWFTSVCHSNSPIYLAGYVPHNWHFGWVTAAMEGWKAKALELAEGTAGSFPEVLLGHPEMTGVAQHFFMQPAFAHVRFGMWQEILAAPAPDESLVYANGVWQYARGRALAATGDLDGARAALEALMAIRNAEGIEALQFFGREGAPAMLAIAYEVLDGEIAAADGDLDRAEEALWRAVDLEDALPYTEPPDWYYPARHSLGAVQLAMGDAKAAEETYLKDLEHMKENGWALAGLRNALQAQGRTAEAAEVQVRFEAAWAHADVEIDGSAPPVAAPDAAAVAARP